MEIPWRPDDSEDLVLRQNIHMYAIEAGLIYPPALVVCYVLPKLWPSDRVVQCGPNRAPGADVGLCGEWRFVGNSLPCRVLFDSLKGSFNHFDGADFHSG
jgi:hypothetical protein